MMPEKIASSNQKWKNEHTKIYNIRVTDSSGVIEAIEKMTEETGISAPQYIRQALLEKLDRDGFISMESVKKLKPGRKSHYE